MDRSFIAFGDSGDVRQLIRIIRAFALAGKLGERLTIVGCAQKRRKMVKWVDALRIDGVTSFADADDGDYWICDPRAAFIFARLHDGYKHRLLDALAHGVPIVALRFDRRSNLFRSYGLMIDVPSSDDVIGLSNSMLTVRRDERHFLVAGGPQAAGRQASTQVIGLP